MSHTIAPVVLALCLVVGLLLVPLGLPGLWIMVGGILLYAGLTEYRSVGVVTMLVVLGLAFLGEIVEWWIGYGMTRRYGGSRRAGWGALIGGIVGAVVGGPGPIVGSVVAAFVGSGGAARPFEYSGSGTAA